MVEKVELLLLLLGVVGVLAVLAERLRFPFPIVLVIAGLGIGLAPGLPVVTLHPEIVLELFLPPILYSAAFAFPWDAFRSNIRVILALAIGLVLVTMTSVALVGYWLAPGLTLASAFVLGAIVSPPDAVAATAVLHRLRVPQRLVTVLEGESLVNDSSGLVAYQFAVAAVVTHQFSLARAGGEFFLMSAGGVAFGIACGWIAAEVHRRIENSGVAITLQILTAYGSYLIGEWLNVSGVLAAVSAGLLVGNRAGEVMQPGTRLRGVAVWEFINYLLNGLIFILIGLQFPEIMSGLKDTPFWQLAVYGAVISAVVIVVRFVWVLPGSWLARRFARLLSTEQTEASTGALVVASWAGMRGIVSLAAALALPMTTNNGQPFPGRNMILFLTFSVIFTTLVLQGLTLPWVVRLFGVEESEDDYEKEISTRIELLRAAIRDIETNALPGAGTLPEGSVRVMREYYHGRLEDLELRLETAEGKQRDFVSEMALFQRLTQRSRERLLEMRRRGAVTERMRRRIEFHIDTEEERVVRVLARLG
jgi:Na+/H+ antiporter